MTESGRRRGAWAIALAGAGMAGAMAAQAVEVEADVAAAIVYSDNVGLAPEGLEDGDFVGQLTPQIRVAGDGARYDAWLDYQLQLFYYLDSPDSTGVYSTGSTGLDLEILSQHLFLDSRAAIDQVLVDPESLISSSNLPVNNNRTDAVTLETTPRWEHEIFGASFLASYKIGHIDFDASDVQDVDYRYTDVSLDGPERERGLSWSAVYEHRRYEYDFTEEQKRALGQIYLYWNMGGGWAPFGSWGKESDIDDRTDDSLTDNIWSAGLRHSTGLTIFEASMGERSFGTTWSLLLERQYGSDMGDIIRLTYDEEPRTNEDISLVEPLPDDPLDPLEPPDVTPVGAGVIYIQKRGELRIARSLSRTRVNLVGFYEQDELSVRSGETESSDTEQRGASLTVDYDVGSRTRLRGQGLISYRDFGATSTEPADDDRILWLRLGVSRELGPRTSMYFWIAREEQKGSSEPGRSYEENQVGVSVSRSLF